MKKRVIYALFVLPMLMFSCGEEAKKEFELTAGEVKGGMKDYIEIVPGSYKLSFEQSMNEFVINIKLKSKETTDIDFVEVYNSMMDPISIQLLDENGNPPSWGGKMNYTEGSDKISKLLKNGEENSFKFTITISEENLKDIKLSKFILNTNATEQTESSSNESSSSDSDLTVDCEQFVKDYEEFADSYVVLMKKYKKNPSDPTILSEYASSAEKAQEMQENANTCDDPKYAGKIAKIASKIAQAVL